MKKLYIRFEEGNEESLKLACDEAERLGYVKFDKSFEGTWLLECDDEGEYFTTYSIESELIENGFSEHILPLGFKRGERVLVNKGWRYAPWEERIFLGYIAGALCPYVIVTDAGEHNFHLWIPCFSEGYSLIKPLIKAKKKMTIAEIENLLGHWVLISKD